MKLRRFRGKAKGIFFKLRIDWLIPSSLFIFFAQMAKLSKWIVRHRKINYSDFYTAKFDYTKRYELYDYVIEKEKLGSNIDYLEFGVSKGLSFKWWVNRINNKDARFFGFDTFTGLPEDWGPFKKGDMANNNHPPKLNDLRCKFYQGLFQQTVPEFLKSYSSDKRKVIHMDADLYSSTLFVLTTLSHVIKKNDIIFFDEFNVPLHEYKAFIDWTSSFYINYKVLGGVNNYYQVAIKIL